MDQGHTDPDAVVRVRDLRKRFGDTQALDGLDFDVPRGAILGFLGPNGSGKTTTIRSVLGLVRPDGGTIELLGRSVPADLPSLRGRIGAIVDQPNLYPPLSGRANLQIVDDLMGGGYADGIDAVLTMVGLGEVADRPVRGYSLGMRQRLAMGAALLSRPELLLLDEPANGLDPAGQQELRTLLREIRDAGATVVVSSHLLAEVEVLCDHVVIIDRGKLVTTGRTADLLSRQTAEAAWQVDVRENTDAAIDALASAGLEILQERPLVVSSPDSAAVTRVLGEAGVWLSGLWPARPPGDLESLFLQLTSSANGAAGNASQEQPR